MLKKRIKKKKRNFAHQKHLALYSASRFFLTLQEHFTKGLMRNAWHEGGPVKAHVHTAPSSECLCDIENFTLCFIILPCLFLINPMCPFSPWIQWNWSIPTLNLFYTVARCPPHPRPPKMVAAHFEEENTARFYRPFSLSTPHNCFCQASLCSREIFM